MTARYRFDYFVLLAEMRTGSNVLEANLNMFQDLHCHGEAFNTYFIGDPEWPDLFGLTLQDRNRDPDALLAAVRGSDGLNGFRFFHDHEPRILDTILHDPRCAKIILTRNPLDSYVSYLIARETDQWWLGDVRDKIEKKVMFDPEEFESIVRRQQGFQSVVARALQVTGQSAFHIAYENVNDLEVLNGAMKWLGGAEELHETSSKFLRQNPGGIEEKLLNPEAIEEGIARIDRLNIGRMPMYETQQDRKLFPVRACRSLPVAFVQLYGRADTDMFGWMRQIDGDQFDTLRFDFTPQTWRDWLSDHPRRVLFTVAQHPLRRAHDVYMLRVVTGELWHVRNLLRDVFNAPMPEPDALSEYDIDTHRQCFAAYLKFVASSHAGQMRASVEPFWASQSRLIEAITAQTPLDHILREARLEQDLPQLGQALGVDLPEFTVPEPDHVDGLLESIYDHDLEGLARIAYGIDYVRLGYGDWAAV